MVCSGECYKLDSISVTTNTARFPNQERRRLFLRQGALDDAQTPSKCMV